MAGYSLLHHFNYRTAIILSVLLIFIYFPEAKAGKFYQISIEGKKLNVETAATKKEKINGLSGRIYLPENQGMLFIYSAPKKKIFWMSGMLIPIDIIYIRDNTVVSIVHNARPPEENETPQRYPSIEPVDMVLETQAGWASKNGIKRGSKLTALEPRPLSAE